MPETLSRRQNWESLRVFVACARYLNFTRAAHELGLSQAAISQRVAALERRLKTRLFVRRPRLALTPNGSRLAPQLSDAFSAMERALAGLAEPRVLSVTTTVSFATLWLLRRLQVFRKAHGDISIALEVSDDVRTLDDDRFDVAIRTGARPATRLSSEHLFPVELTPTLARSLVDPTRRLTTEVLTRLPLLPDASWVDWFRAAGARPPTSGRRGELFVNSQHLALEPVLAGEAVGLLSPRFVSAHVASGRLVQPFGTTITQGEYRLVWRADRGDEPEIRMFRDWLGQEIRLCGNETSAHGAN